MGDTNRRSRWQRQRRFLKVIAAVVLVWAGAHFALSVHSAVTSRAGRAASDRRQASTIRPVRLVEKASRPIYPYSVIRGGAYNAGELVRALDVDPVAARHYSVFRRSLVRTVGADFSAPVFVSYRVGAAIYWTSRPIRLPRGETLLTDGTNYARARCGNRISQSPQTPVNETEPATSAMDEAKPPAEFFREENLDIWSEDRLDTETPSPFALVGAAPSSAATPVTVLGMAPPAETPPLSWSMSAPSGLLYLAGVSGGVLKTLAPNLPPPSSGTGPAIQPNPIPGLMFPPPESGISSAPTSGALPLPLLTLPGSPITLAGVPELPFLPPWWPPTTSGSPLGYTPYGPPYTPPVLPEINQFTVPDTPEVPLTPISTPEPDLLPPVILVLAAMTVFRCRQRLKAVLAPPRPLR